MEVTEKFYTITTADQFPLSSTVFSASPDPDKVIVVASGVGIPRYVYYQFAHFLALNGYQVLTFDYRGIYESKDVKFAPSKMRMEEWGKKDIEAILQFALNELNAQKLYFIGHSGGGQLVGLSPSSIHVEAMVFLSVTLGHWRYWPGALKWGVFLFWYLMPILTWRREYFPARLLKFSSIDIPSGVTRQWASWGKSSNYLFDYISLEDKRRYENFEMPLFSMSFDDDRKLGPRKAVDEMLTFIPNVTLTRKHIRPEDYSVSRIGHFGFFKNKFRDSLWEEILDWLPSK